MKRCLAGHAPTYRTETRMYETKEYCHEITVTESTYEAEPAAETRTPC